MPTEVTAAARHARRLPAAGTCRPGPAGFSIRQPATVRGVFLCTAGSRSRWETCSQASACHQTRAPPLPNDSFLLASDFIYISLYVYIYICKTYRSGVWEVKVPSCGMLSPGFAPRDPCPQPGGAGWGVTFLVGRSRGSSFEQGCRIGFNSQLQRGSAQARQNLVCLQHHGVVHR